MSEIELSILTEKIDVLRQELKGDIGRLDRSIGKLTDRLDARSELGHEVRIKTMERRLDGLWTKVTGLIALIGSGLVWLSTFLRGLQD